MPLRGKILSLTPTEGVALGYHGFCLSGKCVVHNHLRLKYASSIRCKTLRSISIEGVALGYYGSCLSGKRTLDDSLCLRCSFRLRRLLLRCRVAEAFDVGNEFHDVILRESALKGGHIVGVTRGDVLGRLQNRIAQIGFVRQNELPALQWHRAPVSRVWLHRLPRRQHNYPRAALGRALWAISAVAGRAVRFGR